MELISERTKLDVSIVGQTVTNTTVTGKYFPMAGFHRACFHAIIGAMAASKHVILAAWNGKTAAGTSGALIAGATCQVEANVLVSKATVTLATTLAADWVEVNGIRFLGHGTTTTPSAHEFDIGGSNTENAVDLCTCLNDQTYGIFPLGLIATPNAAVVTIEAIEPGEALVTLTSSGSTLVLATLEASAYVEVDNLDLLGATGFDHIAAHIDSSATGICSVTLLREARNEPPSQMVGASEVL
jgi:hypothetical protein